jgi:membrane fusion protein
MTDLFRKEALQHSRDKLFGDLIVQKPLSFAVLGVCTAAFVVVLVAFLCWGQFSRKQTVLGYLVPSNGLIKVYAADPGVVTERHVQEGAEVRKGDVLFVVSTNRGSSNTPDLNRALQADSSKTRQALLNQITKTQALGSVEQRQGQDHIASLKQELDETRQQMDTERQRVAILQSEYAKLGPLKDRGLISDTQLKDQYGKVLAEQFELQNLQKSITDLGQQLSDAKNNLTVSILQTQNQVAGYQKDLAQLDQQDTELAAQKDFVVEAPADGVATSVLVDPGQEVTPNVPLLAILPKGSVLEARLFVPTRAIGFIAKGQQVLLRYDAFPYQHFGLHEGTVQDISKSIVNPNELPVPIPLTEPVYPVTVILNRQVVRAYGSDIPLQAGMALQADVILGHQRLIQWILDPLYSVQGHI